MDEKDFDLKPYIEDGGGDYSAVRLWKIAYGDPIRSPALTSEEYYVLAVSASHAIAISDWYTSRLNRDSKENDGFPDTVFSVEAVSCTVLVDPRFVISGGTIECPRK